MPQDASTLRVHGTTAAGDLDVSATLIAADSANVPARGGKSSSEGSRSHQLMAKNGTHPDNDRG